MDVAFGTYNVAVMIRASYMPPLLLVALACPYNFIYINP